MALYSDGIHLVADSLEELHCFAQQMNIGKHWFEGVRKGHPHYDIPEWVQKRVMSYAKHVRPREVLRISKLMK